MTFTTTDARRLAIEAISGHGALQEASELTALLTLLATDHAGVIVEIGAWSGGLTWALGQLPHTRKVVAIDQDPKPDFAANVVGSARVITLIKAASQANQTRNRLIDELGEASIDALIIDGGHFYDQARADWDLYSPLVAAGGLVAIHDTQGMPDNAWVEVPKLWAELTAEHPMHVELVHTYGQVGTGIIWPARR